MHALRKFSAFIGSTFALWAILASAFAYVQPSTFAPLISHVATALGVIMFGMGLTLQPSDFSTILNRPIPVILGVIAQFALMPVLAVAVVKLFHVEPTLALGIILVGCCPGGTSSNVITYLAKGDVALSVTITAISTLLAPFLTPLLLQFTAHSIVHIPASAMMLNIAKVVLLPIFLGVVVHYLLGRRLNPILEILPLISTAGILFILLAVVGKSQPTIAKAGLTGIVFIFSLVALHNLLGYLSGWIVARLCGLNQAQRRAIMVEVGMQNSGLGAQLATKFFTPESALPSVFFSIWHNVSGAVLANLCRLLDKKKANLR